MELHAIPQIARTPVLSAFLTTVELLGAQRASLLLRESENGPFLIAAAVGINPHLASTIRVDVGQGIAGAVAESGSPLLGVARDGTFLSVPIVTDQGVEGIINFTERQGGVTYTPRDLVRAEQAATHLGQLLEFDRLVLRDPLTGLHNRRALDESVEREVSRSRRLDKEFAVVFLDLDNLKELNDGQGHQVGDDALRAMGETLAALRRPYDVAARYGGDEFVLVLTDLEDHAGLSPEVIKNRIADHLRETSERINLPLEASVGVAYWPHDGATGGEVVTAADARMYEDKRHRKGRGRPPR